MSSAPPAYNPAQVPDPEPLRPLSGGQEPATAVRGCLGFMASLIVVGVVAEMLYNISPGAAYAFVAAVLIGYAASGGNVEKVTAFFTSVQKGTKGGN